MTLPASVLVALLVAAFCAGALVRGCALCTLSRNVSRDRRLDDALPGMDGIEVAPNSHGLWVATATFGEDEPVSGRGVDAEAALDALRTKGRR